MCNNSDTGAVDCKGFTNRNFTNLVSILENITRSEVMHGAIDAAGYYSAQRLHKVTRLVVQ